MNGTNVSDLDHLREFAEIARLRSFRQAAAGLGIPVATLSRHIRLLEGALGMRLFDRRHRQLALTADGQQLFALVRRPLADLEAAVRSMEARLTPLSGTVRVATTTAIAAILILPVLPRLRQQYPGLTVEALVDPEIVNMRDERVDFAIRAGNVMSEEQVRRKIARHHFVKVASSAEPDPHGLPVATYDPGLIPSDDDLLVVKDAMVMYHSVLAGQTSAWLPDALVLGDEQAGRLTRIRNGREYGFDIFLSYPDRQHVTERARIVMDQIALYAQETAPQLEAMLPPAEESQNT